MTAASRALLLVIAVLVAPVVTLPLDASPAGAQAGDPICPATVADLPLSVATPFSGTVRHVTGGSSSLLCAYGEGVEPSAELRVTWADGCGESTTAVAPSLRAQPFERAADDLVDGVGGACPPTEPAAAPVVPLAAGGAALALLGGGLVLHRRRRRWRPAPSVPEPAVELPPEPVELPPAPVEVPPEPVVVPVVAGPATAPDVEPVLALLETPSGRAFARTAAGQWTTVSALAYLNGDAATGDLARTGAMRLRSGRRPPRPEVARVADRLAHQGTGGDR